MFEPRQIEMPRCRWLAEDGSEACMLDGLFCEGKCDENYEPRREIFNSV